MRNYIVSIQLSICCKEQDQDGRGGGENPFGESVKVTCNEGLQEGRWMTFTVLLKHQRVTRLGKA